jgi:CubicO group peptidase (beta-lactamase class C family)
LLCSGVFVAGRAAAAVIDDDLRHEMYPVNWDAITVAVDDATRTVTLTLGDTRARARAHGGQGATILPPGLDAVHFTPTEVTPDVPDAATTPWPMGDLLPDEPAPAGVDQAALDVALALAFDEGQWGPDMRTRGLVVCQHGRLVAERYATGFDRHSRHICFSMGKSITAALVGVLVREGVLGLHDYAPLAEWQGLDDPRRMIRLSQLLNMSSGLLFRRGGQGDPAEIALTALDDHMLIYYGGVDVFAHAISRPLEFTPGAYWRYRNCDPLTLGAIVRRTVEARGEDYLTFPQRALFDRIGMREMVLETDPWGNFIMTGFEYGTPRDWARFGLLHLWNGLWQPTGERLLTEQWVEFIRRPAPAAPDREYGGQFWLNAGGAWPDVPRDAYSAQGARGQVTLIVPSRDAVIVRMGHTTGSATEREDELYNDVFGRILAALE